MARFSSDVACLRGTAHAGMLGAWLLILYITDNHSTTSRSDSARWPFTSVTGSTPKPARSVAPSRWRTPTRCPYDASALAIAKHLESLDVVRFVAYPGLESHPHHEVAVSQLARPDSGFGGVLSFGLDTNHDGHNRFVSKLNVITSAVSLGHDESLIVFLGEDDERQYLYPPEFHRGFFRLAVGLEDTDDLIRDIDHALVEAGFEV